MTQVDGDNLGRRRFQIRQEKAAEDAFEKIRRNIGSEVCLFSPVDNTILKEILGEVWLNVDRIRWGSYRFSKISRDDVFALINIGKAVRSRERTLDDALGEIDTILLGRTK